MENLNKQWRWKPTGNQVIGQGGQTVRVLCLRRRDCQLFECCAFVPDRKQKSYLDI
jgi:hypothetical protein